VEAVAGQSAKISASVLHPLLRDERLYQQARALAATARTPAELSRARQAMHMADEVMDGSFTIAMAQAAFGAGSQPDPAALARVRRAQAAVQADTNWLAKLHQRLAAKNANQAQLGMAEQLAQAQLDLDQARLHDATTDAARSGGGGAARIQQLQQEHEAIHAGDQPAAVAAAAAAAVPNGKGLAGALVQAWDANGTMEQLAAAEAAARRAAAEILAEHNQAHAQLLRDERAQAMHGVGVRELRQLTAEQHQVSRFDAQLDATGELADSYHQWLPLAAAQRRAALHRAWRYGLILLAILALLGALLRGWERALRHPRLDRTRALTMMRLLQVASEIGAGVVALIVMFGRPPELLTILGLVGAGLTVAFQGTIMSLAGWFVLIGRHGVRIGDWVEINGVVGEVIEIRLLRTVVLETGNWISAGHPTGRRVYFPNSFAFTGSYCNFTTSGQWMWDELAIGLPAATNAHTAAQRVEQALRAELAPEMEQARAEWQHLHAGSAAGVEPTVHLRPNGPGFELVVRYTTPARTRNANRERLWQAIAAALAEPSSAARTA
jgi:small-conductance mechanosensitive channel